MFGFQSRPAVSRQHFKSPGNRHPRRQGAMGREKRLRFEPLEERQLLSVFTVSNLSDGTVAKAGDLPGSLRQAIFDANASPGADTIEFASGLTGTITLTQGELTITDSVTIDGPGATDITISGNNQSRIFMVNDGNNATNINVEIDGLTLANGYATGSLSASCGGAIYTAENLTVKDSIITGNTAVGGGGGIYGFPVTNTTTTIENTTFDQNSAASGGGILINPATGATFTMQDSLVSGNTATATSGQGGAGIYVYKNYGTTAIQNCTITGNTAESQSGGTTTLTRGGGILIWKNFNQVTINIDTVSGNTGADGGGICVRNSNNGVTTIENSTISGNTSTDGGGLFLRSAEGTIVVQNSTISGNNATNTSGGIATLNYQSITIQNSTITGNTAQNGAGGLGVNPPSATYYTPDTLLVRSTIIAGNTDASGQAPDVYAIGTFTDSQNQVHNDADFANCLLGNNTGSGLTAAPVGSPDANGNLVGTPTALIDPKLGPLADNGGPTETCALLTGSPAINAGANPANLTTDQRGLARQFGSHTDMGAYETQPAVTGITPNTGAAEGGTPVTITGIGFTGATAVNFGATSLAAGAFTVVNDTTITCMSPAGTAGAVDVTVATSDGTSVVNNSTDQFTYTTPVGVVPSVTGISPTSGAAGGTVTINGLGFVSGSTTVSFGSTPATNVTFVNATQITCTSPAGTGTVDVRVSTPAGTSAINSPADRFTYAAAAAPTVTGLDTKTGPVVGGTAVTITGTGFTGATGVKFGATSVAAGAFTVINDTTITCTSPAGTAGTVDVTVTTSGGTSAINSPADQFTYTVAAPTVTGLDTKTGTTAGGTAVTITGTGFTGATGVNFGTTSVATGAFTVINDTTIMCHSPAGTVGTVDVRVTTLGGTSAINSPADQFTYAAAAVPTVTGLSTKTGITAGGTAVTIIGTGFTGATGVKFGATSVAAGAFTVINDTTITCTSPAGTAGTVDVTVTTSGGTSAINSPADQFTYTVAAPTVTGLDTKTGTTAGGTAVTITGTGFTGATGVKFGATSVAAGAFTVINDTTITCTSPAGTAGTVDVTVTTSGGTSAINSPADQFTYTVAAPTVTGLNSPSEPVAGGMQVTITGTGFSGATGVKFGTTAATPFTVVSDTQITATVPVGSNGTVDVRVVTATGTSAIVPQDQFTYYMPGCTALGLYDPATFVYLRSSGTAGFATNCFVYGPANNDFVPIVGDWNGDGTQTIGLYDRATGMFYLSNSNATQVADISFVYGPAHSQDIPIVGNWNGNSNGEQTVGLYDPTTSTFYLRDSNTTGFADVTFTYGAANSKLIPLAGDWYGGTIDSIGLYDPKTATFSLRNSNSSGPANTTFMYGPANSGWTPVVGDWNGDGKDSIGLYSPSDSLFYLKNTNQGGSADVVIAYGAPNDGGTPIVGKWMGNAQAETAAQQVVASPDTAALAQAQLAPIVNEAIAQWSDAGLSAAKVQELRQAQFVITDLPGSYLGETEGNVIYLDANAAGNGWFVDPTPAQNEEFSATAGSRQMQAVDPRAVDHIDLLTVVEHELGHVLGLKDLSATADDIMDGVLGVGTRRTVSSVDAALAQ